MDGQDRQNLGVFSVGPKLQQGLGNGAGRISGPAGRPKEESMIPTRNLWRALMCGLRKVNNRRVGLYPPARPRRQVVGVEDLVASLCAAKPFVAGKIGGAELMALEYMDHKIKLNWPAGWSWERPAGRLYNSAGFFPIEKKAFLSWHALMTESIATTDFLCEWQTDPFLRIYETNLIQFLAPRSKSIPLEMLCRGILPTLAPFRLLIISPFVKTMQKQLPRMNKINDPYEKLAIDWGHLKKTLQFIRCPFQSHLEPSPYDSWEDGLEKLTKEVSSKDFDLALIGAGAWSLPLGSRIKKMGKSAIHMGGEMQLLFGIKGKRWAQTAMYNSNWVTADPNETPQNRNKVEDGCYW